MRQLIVGGLLTMAFLAVVRSTFVTQEIPAPKTFELDELVHIDYKTPQDWADNIKPGCLANNVTLDLGTLFEKYAHRCVSNTELLRISGDDTIVDPDKLCEVWPKISRCLKPLFSPLEQCYSGNGMNYQGILSRAIPAVMKSLCHWSLRRYSDDNWHELTEGGLGLLICMKREIRKPDSDTHACYQQKKLLERKDINQCRLFDMWLECFMDNVYMTCDHQKARQFAYRIVNGSGFRDIVVRKILECK